MDGSSDRDQGTTGDFGNQGERITDRAIWPRIISMRTLAAVTDDRKNPLGPTGERVRHNVERLRLARNMGKKDLSTAVSQLGRAIPPLGISRIEAGTRRVDADDLVVLALALNVSPLTLLLSDREDEAPTALTNDFTATNRAVWSWALGKMSLVRPRSRKAETAEEHRQMTADYNASREEYQKFATPVSAASTSKEAWDLALGVQRLEQWGDNMETRQRDIETREARRHLRRVDIGLEEMEDRWQNMDFTPDLNPEAVNPGARISNEGPEIGQRLREARRTGELDRSRVSPQLNEAWDAIDAREAEDADAEPPESDER